MSPRTSRGASAGAALALVVATVVLAVVAAAVSGQTALLGVLAGGALVLAVFTFGAVVVGMVAMLVPKAALLVALLTYTLQLLLLLVVFIAFHDSADAQAAVSGDWLGGGMVAATLAWITGQLVVTVRTPVAPWPPEGSDEDPEAGAK